jgi:site-specific recombinase XerD
VPRRPTVRPPSRALPANVELVNQWLEFARREQGLGSDTIYKYGLSMRSLLEHLGKTPLTEATPDQLREWVHQPHRRTGVAVSPATIKRKTCELRSLWNWMADVRQLVRWNTARQLQVPTVHNEEPKPVGDELWRVLWSSDLSTADRVAFGLGFFCGLRRHEVTLLRVSNFVEVPAQRIGNFKRKGGKRMSFPYVSCSTLFEQRRPDLIGGSAGTFLGPLADLLVERRRLGESVRLLPWREQQSHAPWSRHEMPEDFITPGSMNKHLRRALHAAGLDELAFSPHQLRHSFGTNMLHMGVPLLDVSRLMGHSSIAVTQRYLATVEDPLVGMLVEPDVSVAVEVLSPWV